MLFHKEKIFHEKTQKKKHLLFCCEYSLTPTPHQQQQFNNNNNNNNNNDEFPNVHAEKVVDVYVSERVSRAETRAEEKSVGRVVVILIG